MKPLKPIFTVALCLGLSLAYVFSAGPAMAQSVVKIGVVDIQRGLNESKKGQASKAKLKAKFDRYQKELKTIEDQLNREQQELEKQSAMLSPEAKYEKDKNLKRKVRDFQDKYKDYSEEMKRDEFEATQPVLNDLIRITRELGKEKGYSLIMEMKAGVVYVPDALDLTPEVMSRLDAGK